MNGSDAPNSQHPLVKREGVVASERAKTTGTAAGTKATAKTTAGAKATADTGAAAATRSEALFLHNNRCLIAAIPPGQGPGNRST